jgi:hypothetical protein
VTEPSPIACRMDALTPAERARRSEVFALLTRRAVEVVETADGIAVRLRGEPDTPALAGEFVAYEARCCPFIRFELAVEAEGGPVRLTLGGREGVGEFLRAMFPAGGTRSGTSSFDSEP